MPNDGAPLSAPVDSGSSQSQGEQNNQTQQQQVRSDSQPTKQEGGNKQAKKADGSKQESQPKVWKHKVNNKEVVWEKEEDLLRDASLGKTAYEKMREAAEEKKKALALQEAAKKNPLANLESLPENEQREIIEKFYAKKWMETDNLDPKDKELRELREFKQQQEQAKKDEEARLQQEAEQKKAAEEEKTWGETYQNNIIEALDKGGLPKNRYIASRVAHFMAESMELGFEAPIDVVINKVLEEQQGNIGTLCGDDVPMERILKILPKNLVQRLRKYDVEQYRKRQAGGQQQPLEQSEEQPKERKAKREERPSYAAVLRKLGN